jgi:translation elongation factor EF-1alpha
MVAEAKKYLKIIFLGPSDSGKSTLLKQLKIVYGDGFTQEDKLRYKRAINENIYDSIVSVINCMATLDDMGETNDIQVI